MEELQSAPLDSQHSTFGVGELSRQVELIKEKMSERRHELAAIDSITSVLGHPHAHHIITMKIFLWIVIL